MAGQAPLTQRRGLPSTVALSVTVQGVGVLPDRIAALMSDQVDLHETGHHVIPLRPGPDRDGVLQQRTRLGVVRPRNVSPALSGASRRSIVAADITVSAAATLVADVQLTKAPQPRHQLAHHRREPLTRRRPSTAQQNRSPTTKSCPYWGTRGRRGRTTLGTSPCPSALRAWWRCQPVMAHNSSRIAPFPTRLARSSRTAIALVAACRWLIVSPITETYRSLHNSRHALRARL